MISCLCPTHNRRHLLQETISFFDAQTHADKELVFVASEDDVETTQYLRGLNHPNVVSVIVSRPLPIGKLRNISIAAASGDYVAIWDDDDVHQPDRLSAQWECLKQFNKPACTLSRITLEFQGQQMLSHFRYWEGTTLTAKELLKYPEIPKHEDTPALEHLITTNQVVKLDRPDLYIYKYSPVSAGPGSMTINHWHGLWNDAKCGRHR